MGVGYLRSSPLLAVAVGHRLRAAPRCIAGLIGEREDFGEP